MSTSVLQIDNSNQNVDEPKDQTDDQNQIIDEQTLLDSTQISDQKLNTQTFEIDQTSNHEKAEIPNQNFPSGQNLNLDQAESAEQSSALNQNSVDGVLPKNQDGAVISSEISSDETQNTENQTSSTQTLNYQDQAIDNEIGDQARDFVNNPTTGSGLTRAR